MAGHRPRVLIGNWREEAQLEEERLKDFMRKRERGELLVQKINSLQENVLQKTELSVSKDGFVHFGDAVLLLNPAPAAPVERDPGACGSLALAVPLDDSYVYSAAPLRAPSGVSAVKGVDPVRRNTFHILSVDGGTVDEPIRFGQKFSLGTTGGFSDQMLYLASDHKSFLRFAKKSHLQQVFLTEEMSYLTCWQAAFWDPQLRLEHEGFPVPANSKIIITHCHTNRSLAVPRNFWTRSYFGKEYEVVCHTYLDSHKAEEDKNYWEIVTGNPSNRDGSMLNRPDPQPGGIRKELCEEA
ncbi:cilia- and flagella-associated protein 161 [Indicator indicator]|uniref:cilia- and flagella-associated protein 161 n=1 Tax=Indicator indicator TaxID=1002788 RepID=UPI0023DFBCAD|nr:cilia- and flagella-associated protein 161 [Indicator indicator]